MTELRKILGVSDDRNISNDEIIDMALDKQDDPVVGTYLSIIELFIEQLPMAIEPHLKFTEGDMYPLMQSLPQRAAYFIATGHKKLAIDALVTLQSCLEIQKTNPELVKVLAKHCASLSDFWIENFNARIRGCLPQGSLNIKEIQDAALLVNTKREFLRS